jgi:murein L,D-transpeptidase YcbB/YkuD
MKIPFTFPALAIILFCLCTLLIRCNANSNGKEAKIVIDTIPKKDVTMPGNFSEQTKLKFDSSAISSFFKSYPKLQLFEKDLIRFYSHRKFAYAWFDKDGIIEQAGNLFNKLENIQEEGLPEKIYYKEDLHRMMDQDTIDISDDKLNTSLELMLTSQYFYYARYVWTGLGEKGIREAKWDLPRKKLSYESFLDSLLEVPSSDFMRTEPVYPQYALLKSFLKKYRTLESQHTLIDIKPDKKKYQLGDSSQTIGLIRKRLLMIEDLESDNNSNRFDEELLKGIKSFQSRYGMKEESIITSKLINELNYPIEKRIEQIIVNMERSRWLPVSLRGDYFLVNIPEFRFHAYENDTLAWSMKVVVGKSIHQTAIFNGKMQFVVFSPYWNIPPGIMQKEILPALRRNRNYLAKNNMEWFANGIRQKPGPLNALGKVKFLFPNSHNIYLHDTPAKSLFEQDQRAFSHGCIRVEQPKRLAIYVLRHQPEWTEEKIDEAMNAEKEFYVTIVKPIPVLIAYFTSWVDKNGKMNFRNDLYKRDSRLAKMIIENSHL